MLNPFGLIHSLALSVCVVQFLQGNPQVVSPTGIQFRGNKVFSDDQLISAMQLAFGLDVNGSTDLSVDRAALKKGADRARKFMGGPGIFVGQVLGFRPSASDDSTEQSPSVDSSPGSRPTRC